MLFRRFLAAALLAISLAGCAGSFAPPAIDHATALLDDHLVAAPVAAAQAEALPQAVSAADVEATLAYLQQTRMVALAGQQRVYLYGNSFNPVLDCQFSAGGWSYSAASFTAPGTGCVVAFSQSSVTTQTLSNGNIGFPPINLLVNSASFSTQNVTTVAQYGYVLSCGGSGSITLSGTASHTLNCGGAFYGFTATAGTLTATRSGTVTNACLQPTFNTAVAPSNCVNTGASPYYGPRDDYGCQYPTTIANCGILIEQASANEEPNARDMTQASWTKGATITVAHTATGIDGVANSANLITGGATTATNTVCGALTITSEAQTGSFYIEPVTVTGAINISINGGSTWTNIAGSLISSKFVRPSAEATLANPSLCVQVANNNDQIIVDANQVEDLTFPTSFIPTSSSQVSRAADVATATLPASAVLGGTMQADAMWSSVAGPKATIGYLAALSQSPHSNSNLAELSIAASGQISGYVSVGGVAKLNVATSGAIAAGIIERANISYGSSAFAYANGSLFGSTAVASTPQSLAAIYLGGQAGLRSLNGWLSRLFINAPPLSRSRAQQNSVNQ